MVRLTACQASQRGRTILRAGVVPRRKLWREWPELGHNRSGHLASIRALETGSLVVRAVSASAGRQESSGKHDDLLAFPRLAHAIASHVVGVPVETPEADAPINGSPKDPSSEPEPGRSLLKYWFGWKAA
jgi:hypothetical protein